MPEIWAVLEQRDGALAEQSGELLAELARALVQFLEDKGLLSNS